MYQPSPTELAESVELIDQDIRDTTDALLAASTDPEASRQQRILSRRLVMLRRYRMEQHRALIVASVGGR